MIKVKNQIKTILLYTVNQLNYVFHHVTPLKLHFIDITWNFEQCLLIVNVKLIYTDGAYALNYFINSLFFFYNNVYYYY
jgi:hypothetical protein